jgi:hypothetical protein
VARFLGGAHRRRWQPTWDRSFGGSGDFDWAYNVKAAADGGVIVVGESNSGINGNKPARILPWAAAAGEAGSVGRESERMPLGGTVRLPLVGRHGRSDAFIRGRSYSPSGNKTAPHFDADDIWVIKLAERIAPVGMPVILVNGLFSPTNVVTVTNSALIQIQSTFSNGVTFFTLNGAPPASGTLYTGSFVLNQSATIRAIAFNVAGLASPEVAPLNVAVISPPNLVFQPQDQTVGAGADVIFAALAAGTPPFGFQWLREGVAVPGATNALLRLPTVPPPWPPRSCRRNAGMVIARWPGRSCWPRRRFRQPVSATVSVGGSVTFFVSAFGPPPPKTQWRKNGRTSRRHRQHTHHHECPA